MRNGYQTLQRSVDINDPNTKQNKFLDSILSMLSILFAIGLFFGTPLLLADFIQQSIGGDGTIAFNIISGLIRIVLFLLYLIGISFLKDIQRIFQFQ